MFDYPAVAGLPCISLPSEMPALGIPLGGTLTWYSTGRAYFTGAAKSALAGFGFHARHLLYSLYSR
ncbi:MAG: hypothetical protein JRF40_15055 [Deltaproteobacteria bacterium]|nr:hypothetical protein [Deltaproteobacteria bacterium]